MASGWDPALALSGVIVSSPCQGTPVAAELLFQPQYARLGPLAAANLALQLPSAGVLGEQSLVPWFFHPCTAQSGGTASSALLAVKVGVWPLSPTSVPQCLHLICLHRDFPVSLLSDALRVGCSWSAKKNKKKKLEEIKPRMGER